MAKSCVWKPSKGSGTFSKLKSEFGYDKAWDVHGVASNSKFIDDYKESLTFDREGFPTYQSLIDNDYIQKKVLGLQSVAKTKSKEFPEVENTLGNYDDLLQKALTYNRENTDGNFVAVVEHSDNGIKINLLERNDSNINKFKQQYATEIINRKLSNILEPVGITRGMLSREEVNAGRAGSTQFTAAMGIAGSSATVIRIANNMEGGQALTEEFAHVLVDALYDTPLIQRAMTLLNNEDALRQILGDSYDDTLDFYDGDISKIVEEALGQLLRDKLIEGQTVRVGENYYEAPEAKVPEKNITIFQRLKNFILGLFKKVNYQDVSSIINEANTIMSTLSDELISEKIKIERTNIRNRNAVFNSLSDRIERNINALKEAVEVEIKRSKLIKEDTRLGKKRIESINKYIDSKNMSALGIMIYAYNGLQMLKGVQNSLNDIDTKDFDDKINVLKNAKIILQSYGSFIDTFNSILTNEETEEDNLFSGMFTVADGVEMEANELLKEINNIVKRITSQYVKTSIPLFTKFLKDSLGEDLINLLLKHAGDSASVEDLLKGASSDISFSDLWLDAMRDSSNPILQAYDKIVKQAKDRARLKSIDMFKEIQHLRQQAEAKGITDFEFVFEKDANGHKSGNYVNKDYNWAEYDRQRKLMEKRLDEKYGKNPTGKDRKAKANERREWYNNNTNITVSLDRVPKGDKFPPARLTKDEQDVLDSFLKYKEELDKKYPEKRVGKYKAIQIRKNSTQRMLDAGLSPSAIYSNIKENLASNFLEKEDDDSIFGESTSGLTNFDGTEFMMLPVLYTSRLKNPDELSNDIFGSLFAYTAAAVQYEEMEKIVSPLELGRDIIEGRVTDVTKMQIKETRGKSRVTETINHLGQVVKKDAIISEGSNIFKKLDEFMSSQVYQRYLKDEGTFELFNKKIKKAKVTSAALSLSAVAQLGFNWLANLANVTTGIAMTNIEALAGQYFTAKELFKADAEYTRLIGPYVAESYARNKSNELSLFMELFETRQNFRTNATHHEELKSVIRKIFGKNLNFIGQEAGDNWLYNRVAIAMCMHIKVKYEGKETTLWNVLSVRTKEGTDIKEMYIPDGVVDMLGNSFTKERVGNISRRIAAINHRLFGIYNEDDMNIANTVSLGRILIQYRKWMKPQFNARFEAKRTDLDLGEEVEGYYRTLYRISRDIISELKRGEFQYSVFKDSISDYEKRNIKRALVELVGFAALTLIMVPLLGTDDDDADKNKHKTFTFGKLAEYAANRLVHETGNLAPSYTMITELMKTVQNPAAVLGPMQDCATFIGSAINPTRWNDALQSGDYKGQSHLHRDFMKLPLPVLSQYRQFKRIYSGLDKSIQFYTNTDIR